MYYAFKESPAGTMLLMANEKRQLTAVYWKVFKRAPLIQSNWIEDSEVFRVVAKQLDEYFEGTRQTFDLPEPASGTDFQKKVWKQIANIPYGQTSSYKSIASAIGSPKAVRAVGTAVGSNPLSILVPCHRVLTSNGGLGGYAGGLDAKRVLLKRENIVYK